MTLGIPQKMKPADLKLGRIQTKEFKTADILKERRTPDVLSSRPAPFYFPVGMRAFYQTYGKRWLDVTVASALLVFLLPALLILIAAISTNGGRPIFSQLRVGRDGVPFHCYKLRSMAVDAEARLKKLLDTDPAAAAEWAASQKLACDPRITALGQVLRRTSLDELPQLWNVIRGDMSLVGPRPVVPDELQRYGAEADAYLRLRPGISGAWQVSGRNDLSYADRVRLDAEYATHVSLWTDLGILARTVRAVLWATGR